MFTEVSDDSPPTRTRHGAQNGIAVTWYTQPDVHEYQLEYRQEGETGAWTRVTRGDLGDLPTNSPQRHAPGRGDGPGVRDTGYDLRVSARGGGDGHRYSNAFGAHATLDNILTGPCAKENKVTNLRVSIEPTCATLTWTPPTGSEVTHYRLERFSSGGGDFEKVVLRDGARVSTSRYSDCSAGYRTEGSRHMLTSSSTSNRPVGRTRSASRSTPRC